MTVSFEGIGENVVTFYNTAVTANAASAGYPVKMSGSGEVSKALSGEAFIGVAHAADADFAAVQTGGYVKMVYTGAAPAVGCAHLVASGAASVMVDAGTDETVTVGGTAYNTTGKTYAGRGYIVVDVDAAAGTVGFIL
jgi:hypothetical protein